MKKTLVALAVLALTSASAFAQTKMAPVAPGQNPPTATEASPVAIGYGKGHKTPEQKADRRANKMAKELGLTADQETKVEAVLLAENKEMMALNSAAPRTPGTRPSPAQLAEMKAARDKYDAQLKGILNPDQYTKLLAERKEKREEMKAKRGERMKVKG